MIEEHLATLITTTHEAARVAELEPADGWRERMAGLLGEAQAALACLAANGSDGT